MRKTAVTIILTLLSFTAFAQNGEGFNPFTEDELSILIQDSTVKEQIRFKPTGMLGIRGSYQLNGISSNVDMEDTRLNTYKNISLVYTYYSSLWNNPTIIGIEQIH